jgi:tryptophanyl-tRNA synthetase
MTQKPAGGQVVFSGIQPTGTVHIGNYLGALANWVRLQNEHRCYFAVVDYHAMTIEYDPREMPARVLETVVMLLAVGVDPERAALFVQSQVPEHTELAWILNTVTPMGELERMTQFKDKSRQNAQNINAGLFSYPVLQAADILLYKGTRVPVGEDQVQHLELCREVARRFNARFGETFPEPQPILAATPRILGLDGQAKMSKSLGNAIYLDEEEAELRKKLKSAFTDPSRLRKSDPGHPEICNVYTLHGFFSAAERRAEIERACKSAELGCVDCKRELADRMVEVLGPIRERAIELRARPDVVRQVIAAGGERCRRVAQETMREVRERTGLGPIAQATLAPRGGMA